MSEELEKGNEEVDPLEQSGKAKNLVDMTETSKQNSLYQRMEVLPQKDNIFVSNIISRLQDKLTPLSSAMPTLQRIFPNILEIGPISVIKESNVFTFNCKIRNCHYSSNDKNTFATHCEIIHKYYIYISSTGKCNVCLIKFEYEGKFVTVHDIFLHMVTVHKDFFEHELAHDNSGSKFIFTSVTSLDLKNDTKLVGLPSEEKFSMIPSVQLLEPKVKQIDIENYNRKCSKVLVDKMKSSLLNVLYKCRKYNLNLSDLVPPYNCEEDGFPSCPFKTLYFDEYLKHVETIHQVKGLSPCSSKHKLQKEMIMKGWLAKEVGPFQCRYCKKATVTYQEMGRHQVKFHTQKQCWFYCRKFVPNDTVTIPEQVNLNDPSFINHVIHLPDQVHLYNFDLTDGLLSSTSANVTDRVSEAFLSLQPQSPMKGPKIDQSKVLLDEPEIPSMLVDNEVGLFSEPDPLCIDDEPPKDAVVFTGGKLECKWKGCYKTYQTQSALVKHIEKNHVRLQRGEEFSCFWINCSRNSKPFATKQSLSVHMRIHSGEKSNKCPFQGCNKAFSQLGTLKIHQRKHTGERPYLCQFSTCFKSFTNSTHRDNHQRTHYATKVYLCQVTGCSNEYIDLGSLKRHMKHHTVEEQLKIKSDKNETKKKGDFMLKKFSKSSDGPTYQRRYYDSCKWKGCHQIFHFQMTFVKHIQNNHVRSQSGKEFSCFWINCSRKSKPFTTKQDLSEHVRAHSGAKSNKCPFQGCNKTFSQLGTLKIHKRSHTGERPYLCQFLNCFKSFSTISLRNRHQIMHYNAEAFTCQVAGCLKKYINSYNLRRHMKNHMKSKSRLNENQSGANRRGVVLKKSNTKGET